MRGYINAITGCVTSQPIYVEQGRRTPNIGVVQFIPIGHMARLRTASRRHTFAFGFRHQFAVVPTAASVQSDDIVTTAYEYALHSAAGNEIVAYHWHPDGASSVRHPHVYLSNQIRPIDLGRNQAPLPLADYHLATGVVPLAHLVRMLIEEFGVESLRDDWDAILPRS